MAATATTHQIVKNYDLTSGVNENKIITGLTGVGRLVAWRAELETLDISYAAGNLPYFRAELYETKKSGDPIPQPGEAKFIDQLYFSPASITWNGVNFYASMTSFREKSQYISRSPIIPDLSNLWAYFDTSFMASAPLVTLTLFIRTEVQSEMEAVQAMYGGLRD